MNIPLIIRDDSKNLIRIGENLSTPLNEANEALNVNDNLAPLQVQVCASPTPDVQFNRSSATYSTYAKHSSAHIQFHKQFIQNEFGYACGICDRLWFKEDLKTLDDDSVEFIRTFLPDVDEHSITVCSTCRTSIQKQSIPKMAVHNGFEYPTIPENLQNCPLDLVSERLISPRIPFMQIRRLRHVHGQYGIYGQIINVPMEVNTMVNKLPRNINDDHCIYVHIKRKKIHKSSFLHGLINKRIIKAWLKYLVNTPLYRTYNITIDEQFFDNKHDEELPLDGSSGNDVKMDNNELNENDGNELEDIPIEENLLAQQQTVMWNDDLYLRIAPGENNVPISLLFDEHAEELSFPSIYLGQFRQFREGVTVTPFMMATSELRRSDRRGVTPHHLLYVAMKIMRIRVRDSLTVAFKHIGKKSNITKEEVQAENYIHNCIESNLAFLRSIPNSTWYWSERKKDLFAMIRQLGKPTVFFTISANEIGWLDLLQLLYKLKTHDHITKEEISRLHYMAKSTLINEDAVTCTIYFNKLVNVVMNILQSKTCSPFGKYRVRHYFKRIEFQHRGSPHAHILAWLDNTPKDALNEDYDKAIDLINTLISVSAAEASGNIKLQTHKHTFTCYKKITAKKPQKCRFEAPFMPCKKTMILTPMKNTEEGFINYRNRYAQIRVRLENEDFEDVDNFYNCNGITSDEDYYNIIRAGITRPKVFVKREPLEKWHNPFNPFIFNIVQSNTDFQFITEEYSCAAYVVEYVNKTNRGVSHLQRKIIETMDEHPEFDIIDITKNISLNILNHTEITSQEAAWYLLREPMSKTSVIIEYIPTVWPIERQRIRKTMKELSELDDDCTDVWKENWFDKYERRPEFLDNITLAQFVSKYTENRKKEFIERREPKIIRYRNYDMATDFNEYKREMVTLHLPFRNEEEEILAEMKFIRIYDDNEDIILQRRKEFESDIDIDKTIQICRELCREETPMDEDEIQDVANRFPEENPFQQLYNNPNSDINSDLQLATLNKLGAIAKKKENILSSADFYAAMKMANEKQRALLTHMDSVKVAVRIRPLVKSESESGCRSCIERIPNEPQISIGKASQMFTFNYVFDEFEGQSKVYNCAVKHLIENLFKGYNLTILAYGQTGSGKTYTMGTNYSGDIELGVIPRAVYDIFDTIETKTDYSYRVTCSFLELYNESLYDLLTNKPREQSVVDMREQHNGVCIPGLTEVEVHSPAEALSRLQEGSQGRVVGATAMNAQSSRSHAIFTFNIRITNKQNPKEVMTSKFHLVDLAGSERSKKTGATGDRFKEGVNINKGLMVLGNVISQLCDGTNSFINYRDSKLTRLLQDSLGGNSVTLMIACVSPADYNQDESFSTLRYADRAKKIKNKPVVNQDPQSAEISKLKKELEDMRLKFIEGGGVSYECPPSHKQLEQKLEDAQTRIKELLKTLTEYMSQSSNLLERAFMAEKLEETMKEKFSQLTHLSESINADSGDIDKNKILQDIKTKILEVQVQRLQCEKEMLSHEKLSGNNKSPFEEDELNTPIRHEHILYQAKINKEIYQITKNLVWKEELMAKLSENVNGLGVIEGISQKEVDDLKKQVESLQSEKEELLSQINKAAVNSANNASKVAEQRRKRLHELEQQKTTLLKKISEQEKIIKMKQNSDEKMKALQADIMSMKQLKVKLIQQMKSENEKFRTWKVEKDREMCLLRSQNVKRQNQLKKMEQQHSLQQNVLKRKLEAAAAANKRIMAVLDRQKQAKMRKLKGPASERIKEKMQEELELLESEYQAQRSLDSLIQDRASLSKELTIVKESLQDNSISQEEKEKLARDMKQIEEGIANRSAEISDLQQKLLDIHHEDRPKGNWDMLQSMGDAKFAVSYLFNLVSEKIKENLNTAQSVSELKEQQHEYVNQLDLYSQKMEIIAANHKVELENLEKECEEKVYILLKRIQEPNLNESEEMVQYKNIKYEELEKIGMLRNRIKELEEEVDTLNKALVVCKPPSTHMEAFENFLEQKDTTFTASKAGQGTRNSKKKTQTFTFELADEERLRTFDDSVEIENDDPNNDPDWVHTPLYKRLQSLKASKRRCNSKNKTNPQCSCQEECSPKSCPCKQDDLDCNENCSCESACKLQEKSNLEVSSTKKQRLMEPLTSIRARRDDYFL
ncbi:uncharacterized protein LOC106661425 isoform X2 [Cimex lectularius]|nr:uncharacterized protein LOC106661425 isoform X2 [Cimex lectularius]